MGVSQDWRTIFILGPKITLKLLNSGGNQCCLEPLNIALSQWERKKVSAFTCSVQYNDLQLFWDRLSNSYRQIVSDWIPDFNLSSCATCEDFAQQLREWPTEKSEPQTVFFFWLVVTLGHRFPTQDIQVLFEMWAFWYMGVNTLQVHKPYCWPRRPWCQKSWRGEGKICFGNWRLRTAGLSKMLPDMKLSDAHQERWATSWFLFHFAWGRMLEPKRTLSEFHHACWSEKLACRPLQMRFLCMFEIEMSKKKHTAGLFFFWGRAFY